MCPGAMRVEIKVLFQNEAAKFKENELMQSFEQMGATESAELRIQVGQVYFNIFIYNLLLILMVWLEQKQHDFEKLVIKEPHQMDALIDK